MTAGWIIDMLTRWYALCDGGRVPACQRCRRFRSRADNEEAARQRGQEWINPEIEGLICHDYLRDPWRLFRATRR